MIESTNIGIVLRNTMCWQGEVESDFWGVDMWKKTASKTRSLRTSPGPDRDRCGQITHLVGGLEHVFFYNIWDNPSQLTNSFQDD